MKNTIINVQNQFQRISAKVILTSKMCQNQKCRNVKTPNAPI